MRLADLDYELPPERIAQHPIAERDDARLMVVERGTAAIEHARFRKLGRFLHEGDLLVLNDTRVFPARLFARKPSGGRLELLMVRPASDPPGGWVALMRAHHAPKEGDRLAIESGPTLRVVRYERPGRPVLVSENGRSIDELIQAHGRLALPPYIDREPEAEDAAAYQTVYAAQTGAVAAPTAGLHFTPALMDELAAAGIRLARLTLHIGPGTFAPVRSAEVEAHTMEAEWYTIPPAARDAIELARRTGGRVIAVGTSSVRALESFAVTGDAEGSTGLFIAPGFRFKLVDAMVTNFHMPRSTVLAMVMAMAGRELILKAYREAIRHRYRFLSYGDAMLIL
ncbi:MAG TPA: tRNA preQ1(34) S-adenosylmethionine ribosyltransferase-isomerase QueA [Candidatus Binataceae bacterium]|nr:tRNA preQ1(34) S-adenosylmethionine ribosyltransferase-isomerase QueA [Candidatus Binataceae bacterium]